MANSDFTPDHQSERLRSYFDEIYEYLLENGVPEECLPSPWHVLRHVVNALDQARLQEWLDAYIEVEADDNEEYEEDEEDESSSAPTNDPPRHRPLPRRPRPPYLSVLTSPEPEKESDEEEPSSNNEA